MNEPPEKTQAGDIYLHGVPESRRRARWLEVWVILICVTGTLFFSGWVLYELVDRFAKHDPLDFAAESASLLGGVGTALAVLIGNGIAFAWNPKKPKTTDHMLTRYVLLTGIIGAASVLV